VQKLQTQYAAAMILETSINRGPRLILRFRNSVWAYDDGLAFHSAKEYGSLAVIV
jgi:hypothetical protein